MIRQKMIAQDIGKGGKFRWRNHEISRIEGLSDAVFAFAITLLVVSLEVPKTFNELAETMHGFGAFLVSFLLLFAVWLNQYKFFRRYGLQDTTTVVINAALLFVVLFYVYPLKFLFTFLIDRFTGGHGETKLPNGNVVPMLEGEGQLAQLMLIFDLGYLAVFGVFVLLYWHAYRKREELGLNELERFDTRESILEYTLNCGIAVFSLLVLAVGGVARASLAGMVYMLTPVVMTINGTTMGRRRRRLEDQLAAAVTHELESPGAE
ncbi:MAG TPA: TMEM175 family protein [Pyrinomonadaceae bacterium]|nr:TMEM175 family protein [Pyrinomonadaceae bacterium]